MSAVIVLDVGKTVSKLSLWSPDGDILARETRANERVSSNGRATLDVDGISEWLIFTLKKFAPLAEVAHIIPVAHGAGLVVVKSGRHVIPPFDYEVPIPDDVRRGYAAERDPFEITGSPFLADGLNAGAQLYWAVQENDAVLDDATIMPWAQYWAWFLSGEMRSEGTSLGCHTDLWAPMERDFSPMAKRLGWEQRFAPVAFAGEPIGQLRGDLAHRTGLSPNAVIHCGLHDSNAALVAAMGFPQFAEDEMSIVSTGTWFVTMRRPEKSADLPALSDERDCLVNVDAWNRPVPSARFMGGREIERLVAPDAQRVDRRQDQARLMDAVPDVMRSGAQLMPCFAPGFGPYPTRSGHWISKPGTADARGAAISLYAALMTNTCLDLVASTGPVLVEGRFAGAEVFVRGLASLRGDDQVFVSSAQNDVSFGALRLIYPDLEPQGVLERVEPLPEDLGKYASGWESHLAEAEYDTEGR